jgi:hypothetical protein
MTQHSGDTGIILFDAAHDPLFFVTFVGPTAGPATDAYMRRLEGLLRRGKPYAMVIDLGKAQASDPASWKKVAAFLRENRGAIERLSIGSAMIVRDSKMRTAISGIAWFEPIRGPYALCMDMDTAMTWVRERFREKSVPFPTNVAVPQVASASPAVAVDPAP